MGASKPRRRMSHATILPTLFLSCCIANQFLHTGYQVGAIEVVKSENILAAEKCPTPERQSCKGIPRVLLQDKNEDPEWSLEDEGQEFNVVEATVESIQEAFKAGSLTSRSLIELYLQRIEKYDPQLHSIIEINPEVWTLADKADKEREKAGGFIGGIHGIPILIKDNIGTKDCLNTTAGSFALLGSVVPRDAGVIEKLRKSGAIILGKANLSEWANFRSSNSSNGWSARGGQTKSPYVATADPCGSSTGSAVATAANLVTVSIGTETDGSIICPSGRNGVVGIKPSVGLTSRAGVIPIDLKQDTVGPICRTVADAVEVLDVIVGFDPRDSATSAGKQWIPSGGYKQFLKSDGLRGKRLGVLRSPFYDVSNSDEAPTLEKHLNLMRDLGAFILNNVTFEGLSAVLEGVIEETVIQYDFKQDLNAYLTGLVESPVRSLADVITFNNENSKLESLDLYDQENFYTSENTTGRDSEEYKVASEKFSTLIDGVFRMFEQYKLDAVIGPSFGGFSSVPALGGYPAISVPAGYLDGVPFGISFAGVKGSEPTLIEIAYAFEHATHLRQPPESFGS
ncbi:hypothetical protein R1sor_025158 [Riccia sorocarpa]|uniref:Amidase domain-containing protein n=1 Tax=Riccia sorocarpa TaxID=122646 RepID=A0ABD3G7T2_9MARC